MYATMRRPSQGSQTCWRSSAHAPESLPWSRRRATRHYGDLKKDTAELVVALLEPVQRRYDALAADPHRVDNLLAAGRDRAAAFAAPRLGGRHAGHRPDVVSKSMQRPRGAQRGEAIGNAVRASAMPGSPEPPPGWVRSRPCLDVPHP